MSDSLHPRHSWPGVFIETVFSGDSVGVQMEDSVNYYDVYIDGKLYGVFHGNKSGDADYVVATNLGSSRHLLKFSQRNISFGIYSFSGLTLGDCDTLFPPPPPPDRKIEFIGDSFTVAEGNEATEAEMEWKAKFPVTDIDSGFATMIARHYQAQYHITARSGTGVVCDWQGNFSVSMLKYFDRTLMESNQPKWEFKQWIPNLVVICLGLNDLSGLKGKDGTVSPENTAIFRDGYHEFIADVRQAYSHVKILAVAAHAKWIQENVRQVVEEEKANGHDDIDYAEFGFFPGGYVASGHPNVETHKRIAGIIIKAIDSTDIFRGATK